MPRPEDQQLALNILWAAARDERGCTLTAEEAASAWRAILDDTQERLRLRDEVHRYRFADPTIRTPAVQAALERVRRTGIACTRKSDGTPSSTASIVGYSLNRGAEAVQEEIDRYCELCLS